MKSRISRIEKTTLCVLIAISLIDVVPLESRSGSESPLQLDESWQFTHPNIRVNDGVGGRYPGIASDQFGRIFVVWFRSLHDVMFSTSTDGGYTWSNSTKVNENYSHPSNPWSENPDMATDGKNVYVCWEDYTNESGIEIYFKKSPIEKIDFTHPDILVSNNTANSESDCSIATDGKNVYIVWEDGYHVYFDWSPVDNISFHEDMKVDTDSIEWYRLDPDIATDGANIYVAWTDERNHVGSPEPCSDIYFDWTPVDVLDFSGPDLLVTTDIEVTLAFRPSIASDGKEVYVAWDDNRTHIMNDWSIYMDHSPVDNLDFSSQDILVNEAWDPLNESFQVRASIDASGGKVFLAWLDSRLAEESSVFFDWSNTSVIDFTRNDTLVSDRIWLALRNDVRITAYDDGLRTHVFVAWMDDRDFFFNIYSAASPPHPLYPDLSVNESDISVVPSEPMTGTNIALNATIYSQGEMGVPNATVTFYVGDPSLNQTIGESTISVLAHNKTYTQTNWTPLLPGDYEIYVVVDPYNVVNESNESNNAAKVRLSVIPHRPPTLLEAILNGKDFENVTIRWSLSPDDGMGSSSVTGYEILRNLSYDPEGSDYSMIASLPNSTSIFIDEFAGEGDPNDYFYRVCSIDLNGYTSCAENQAGKFTRPLIKGTNLLSVPLIQSDESMETVLQTVEFDKAWVYDSSSEKWKWYMTFKPYKGELITVNKTQGFWVNVTNDCNFTTAGIVPFETTIALDRGWNLISFPSFTEGYTVTDLRREVNATISVEGFSPSNEPYLLMVMQETDALEAGNGYWINVAESTSWSTFN